MNPLVYPASACCSSISLDQQLHARSPPALGAQRDMRNEKKQRELSQDEPSGNTSMRVSKSSSGEKVQEVPPAPGAELPVPPEESANVNNALSPPCRGSIVMTTEEAVNEALLRQ
ncbi:unnamed protein product [Boreogadus saida]